MRRLTLLAAALLVGSALSAPAFALQEPVGNKKKDERMRVATYDPGNPVHIVCALGCDIPLTFASDEKIEMTSGARVFRARKGAVPTEWQDSPLDDSNIVMLKALKPCPTSSYTVITRRPDGTLRRYLFVLDVLPEGSDPSAGILSVEFVYPADAAAARAAAWKARQPAIQRQIAKDRLDQDTFYGVRNWKYDKQGDADVLPSEVSDNGQITTLRFPGNAKTPSIFVLDAAGHETLVDYSAKDDMVVIPTTAATIRLRSDQKVADLFNCALAPRLCGFNAVASPEALAGYNPRTGTTSPNVVREVKTPRE